MRLVAKCDLCNRTNFTFLFKSPDKKINNNLFRWYKCNNCGLIFLNPLPSVSESGAHYSLEYHLRNKKNSETYFKLEKLANSKLLVFKLLRPLFRTTYAVPKGRLLDVGCGSGEFLLQMKNKMDCYGIDPNALCCEAQNIRIYKKTLAEAKFPNKFFDIITLYDVLEHLPNPLETLAEARRILKPSGILIVRVPNSESLLFKLFGKHWPGADTPHHAFIFNTHTLKEYLKDSELIIKKIRCMSTPYCIVAILLKIINKNLTRVRFNSNLNFFLYVALTPFAYLCALLHIGDYIEFTAVSCN